MNFGSLLNCILRYSHVAAQNLPQKQEAWLWMRRPAVGSEAIFRCWDYQGTSSTHRHGFVAFEKQQHSLLHIQLYFTVKPALPSLPKASINIFSHILNFWDEITHSALPIIFHNADNALLRNEEFEPFQPDLSLNDDNDIFFQSKRQVDLYV